MQARRLKWKTYFLGLPFSLMGYILADSFQNRFTLVSRGQTVFAASRSDKKTVWPRETRFTLYPCIYNYLPPTEGIDRRFLLFHHHQIRLRYSTRLPYVTVLSIVHNNHNMVWCSRLF